MSPTRPTRSRSRFSHSQRRPSRPPAAEPLEPRTLLAAGPAAMLKDINTTTLTSSSDATSFLAYKGQTWFRANDGVHGIEWWRTDGTAAGTSMFMDLNPGNQGSERRGTILPAIGPGIRTAAVLGDTLFFTAFMPGTGAELWKTDGTVEGTVLVKDTRPGAAIPGYPPQRFMVAGNLLYFMADDGTHGVQLWRSDGTADGTIPLTSIAGGAGPIMPIGAVGDKLVFSAFSPDAGGPGGREPWVTDGTPAGTMLLKNIHPTNTSNPAGGLVDDPIAAVVGNTLYFRANDTAHGAELWKTDGTPAGTVLAADITPGAGSSSPDNLANVNGQLYFSANGANPFDGHVYRLDPASGAAVQVAGPIVPPLGSGSAGAVGGRYFIGGWWNNQAALFMHDPANPDAPLTLVKNLGPSGNWPAGGPIRDDNGVALFLVPDLNGNKTINLWRSNGTADGTFVIGSTINPSTLPDPNAYGRGTLMPGANGLFYYVGRTTGTSDDVYRTDGTAAGTHRLAVLNTNTASSNPGPVVDLGNGRFIFPATDPQHGSVLWVTDGTTAGTALLKDGPAPGIFVQYFGAFSKPLNGRVYFPGSDSGGANANIELWTTDGTAAGTYKVKDINPFGNSFPGSFTIFGGKMYFLVNGRDLWLTDGTDAGTQMVASFANDTGALVTTGPVVVGDAMYLLVHRFDPDGGANTAAELWRSDGTTAGTSLVKVIAPGGGAFGTDDAGHGPPAVALNGLLYFIARPSGGPPVLWRSDGTADGTTPVATLTGTTASRLTVVNGRLLFEVQRPNPASPSDTIVWASDGTTAAPLAGLDAQTGVTGLLSAGNLAYFMARVGATSSYELWRTDGTDAGTRRLLPAGAEQILGVVNGSLYFAYTDPSVAGRGQLWRTDGTEAGTVLVQSTRPAGFAGVNPHNLTAAGDWLFFAADDGTHGVEPWSMPLRPLVAGRWAFYNDSAFDGRDENATAADLAAIATDKAALRPGQAASFANVTSYDKGINGVIVDLAGAPGAALTADDFDFRVGRDGDPAAWAPAPAPRSVVLLPAPTGAALSRYAITWANGAIRNEWLRVTVKANAGTGLSSPDVFYFGNLVGETEGTAAPTGAGATSLRVTAPDLWPLRRRPGATAVTSIGDVNRDGLLNAADVVAIRRGFFQTLPLWTAPAAPPPQPAAQAAAPPASAAVLFGDGPLGQKRRPVQRRAPLT